MAGDRRAPDATPSEAAGADYVLEAQIGHLLRRAHQRATAIFMAELGEAHQMTPTQYAALVKLGDLGAASQNELGRLTAMDPVTIQGVVRRLVARGLVVRSADPDDRRRAVLRLTPEGAVLARRLIPLGVRVTAATLAPLSPADSERLLALLRRIS